MYVITGVEFIFFDKSLNFVVKIRNWKMSSGLLYIYIYIYIYGIVINRNRAIQILHCKTMYNSANSTYIQLSLYASKRMDEN